MQKTSAIYSTVNGVTTRVQAVADGIFRVTHTRRPDFLTERGDVVIYDGAAEGELIQERGAVCFRVGLLEARIDERSGAVSILGPGGTPLLREPDKRPRVLVEKPVYRYRFDPNAPFKTTQGNDGVHVYMDPPEKILDRTAYEAKQNFVFNEGEGLYGLGSHEEGYGNLRGKSRILFQHNLKAVVPVLVSTGGWGVLFNMGCLMTFHDDAEGSYLWAECCDELDWYFFYGKDYNALMGQYRLLTGETPMLPKYALGYTQSKERYKDAQEMIDVAKEYRRRGVGLDTIVLDWQSWPEGQWGWKHLDPARFPDPEGFTKALHDKNVKLMISVWPSMVGDENEDRKEMLEKGYMLGNRTIYDAFNPEARKLYWKQANEGLFSKGVDAWWCDDSEPFETDWRGEIKPEGLTRAMINTEEARQYLDPAKLSLYSLYHTMGIYKGQRGETDEKRVVNLTRSSFAGQHRHAAITWSGDISANWETLRRQIPEGLNFCATGESYWSLDIGAFFPGGGHGGWFFEGDFPRGCEDPGYRELFTRWMQLGVFLPMMRSHGTGTPREIWRFGEKGERFYDAIAAAIRLRYQLVPYLYSLMAQTNASGVPMLRVPALVFAYDPALRAVDDELMLGDAILAKPVTKPMYYLPGGKAVEPPSERMSIYLPKGTPWYDFIGVHRYPGGSTLEFTASLASVPMYVRAGAILPLGADVQHTGELSAKPLMVRVYPGRDGSFVFYDDAGDGYGYEKGESARIEMLWDDAKRVFTLKAQQGGYPGMPEKRVMNVFVAGDEMKSVEYTGEEIKLQF